jgi:hypothetical protein
MFEWFYQLFVQVVTMVLSWFGMDAKAFLGESFKGEEEVQLTQNVSQHVAQTLNDEPVKSE